MDCWYRSARGHKRLQNLLTVSGMFLLSCFDLSEQFLNNQQPGLQSNSYLTIVIQDCRIVAFSALTLLVGRQEGQPASKIFCFKTHWDSG